MNFDFDNFKPRKTKSTRKAGAGFTRKQEYNGIKYQVKEDGSDKFTVSTALWNKLDLDNKALMFGAIEGNLFIGVVGYDHSDAILFTKSKGETKSKTANSTNLRDDLLSVGVISSVDAATIEQGKPNKQFIGLEEVTGNLPEGVEAMYRAVVDERADIDETFDEEAKVEAEIEAEVQEEAAAPVEEKASSVEADEEF